MSITLKQRYDFVAGIKARLGDKFDWFGRGIQPISDKSEAMDSFRYHIAIENHIAPGHWTEKITDCYLAYCLPFYYGPPDIADYFHKDSVIPIDIFDLDGAAKIMSDAIESDQYEKRLPAIIKARDKTLSDYNIVNKVAEIVSEHHSASAQVTNDDYIYGRHIFRQNHPVRGLFDALHKMRHKSPK